MQMDDWDATETAARIAARDVTALEVVEAALSRAGVADPALAAVVTRTAAQARAQARLLDDAPTSSRPAMAGVPTYIKDLEAVAGVVTGFGSAGLGSHLSERTSPSVQQFLATGLVSLGKSATPEYGLTATTEPAGSLPTRNPWDLTRSVGGSSGGAAALVAAGVVPIAHATDGGGSIRIPASACGLVGLKPSRGRMVALDRADQLPIDVAVPGVVTTTVRDTAAFHAAAERVKPAVGMPLIGEVTGPSQRRLRIALVVETPTGRALHPDVATAIADAGRLCETLGHDVTIIPVPFGRELADDFLLYWGLLAAGVSMIGFELNGRRFRPSHLEPWTRGLSGNFRRNLRHVPGAMRRLKAVPGVYEASLEGYDVVMSPTNGTPPPPIGHLAIDLEFDVHRERVEEWVPFTPAQNLSGTPAITLPLGRSAEGLPIGIMVGGRIGDERTLLELAYELEAAQPWQRTATPGPRSVTTDV